MRVGLSWDIREEAPAAPVWQRIIADMVRADELGYDSAWLAEGRITQASCSQPSLFLTYVARRTKAILLRSLSRSVVGEHAVRLAEEVSTLDHFSHGRAGIAFAAANAQGVAPGAVHEKIEFVRAAWATNEIRYRGKYVRFPAHTTDDAPVGPSYPAWDGEYIPQWDWGATKLMPDFLAVLPKPLQPHVPVYVAIDEDATLEWAARSGVSPLVGADTPTSEAKARLMKYRKIADSAGRASYEVDAILERHVAIDGKSDSRTFGGTTHDIVCAIRGFAAATRVGHFLWRYKPAGEQDLARFANEVQTKLQA